MYDRRLIGTWKSDTRRTMRDVRARSDISEWRKNKLRKLFGKLQLRYIRNWIHIVFGDRRESDPYTVLGKDSDTVCIESTCSDTGESHLQHLHFDGGYYWISLGQFREWFRKQPS